MTWQDILKAKDKDRPFMDATRREQVRRVKQNIDVDAESMDSAKIELRQELTNAINEWGEGLDRETLEGMEGYPETSGILNIGVTFENMYEGEEDLDEEELFEEDEGYYRIDLTTKNSDVATCDFTYNDGFKLVESSFENLNSSEMQQIIDALGEL